MRNIVYKYAMRKRFGAITEPWGAPSLTGKKVKSGR